MPKDDKVLDHSPRINDHERRKFKTNRVKNRGYRRFFHFWHRTGKEMERK